VRNELSSCTRGKDRKHKTLHSPALLSLQACAAPRPITCAARSAARGPWPPRLPCGARPAERRFRCTAPPLCDTLAPRVALHRLDHLDSLTISSRGRHSLAPFFTHHSPSASTFTSTAPRAAAIHCAASVFTGAALSRVSTSTPSLRPALTPRAAPPADAPDRTSRLGCLRTPRSALLHSRSFRFPSSKRWPNFRCWGNDQIDSDRTESDRILFLSSSFISS